MPSNIVTTPNIHVRARMRRLLSTSFNAQSLLDQAPALERYANIVIDRLSAIHESHTSRAEATVVNMLDWTNFYAMDIIGDLAMGESFHCLEQNAYHTWVQTLFMFFKGMIIAAAFRFFPGGWVLLQTLIPKRIREQQKQHTDFTNTKIRQRVELKTNRPDFLTPFLHEMKRSPDKMSLGEIQSTFGVILVAGSETTATTLVGCLYRLASNLLIQEKLWYELKRFTTNDSITVESTKSLEYLEAVLNESLRLCYAVPGGLPRIVPHKGDTYAGQFVPGGVRLASHWSRFHANLCRHQLLLDLTSFCTRRSTSMTRGSSIRTDGFRSGNVQQSTPTTIWRPVSHSVLARRAASESLWHGRR